MANRIMRKKSFESLKLDREFLYEFFKIVNKCNPRNILMKTQIIINSKNERSEYDNLKDFIDSRIIPDKVDSISFRKSVRNQKDVRKVVQFHLQIDSDNPYYNLIAYDDGKLSSCQKKLDNLMNQKKNWYYFLYNISNVDNNIWPFFASISAASLLYKMLIFFPFILVQEYSLIISCVSFFLFFQFIEKISNYFFPFIDYQIQNLERNEFWRVFSFVIITGLIVNLIWFVLNLFF